MQLTTPRTARPVQVIKPKAASAPKMRAPKVLLGGTEGRGNRHQAPGTKATGTKALGTKAPGTRGDSGLRASVPDASVPSSRRARRGKGPNATVFDGGGPLAGWYGHAEPGIGSKANRREVATCADPRVVALVPCRTPWERAHLVKMYDKDTRAEMLAPNAVGKGRNVVPLPGSVPRLYPAGEMTRPDAHGRGGYRSFDDVYDETEMRRRAMDRALGVVGGGGGGVADAVFVAMSRPGAAAASRQRTGVRLDGGERAAHLAHERRVEAFLEGQGV